MQQQQLINLYNQICNYYNLNYFHNSQLIFDNYGNVFFTLGGHLSILKGQLDSKYLASNNDSNQVGHYMISAIKNLLPQFDANIAYNNTLRQKQTSDPDRYWYQAIASDLYYFNAQTQALANVN